MARWKRRDLAVIFMAGYPRPRFTGWQKRLVSGGSHVERRVLDDQQLQIHQQPRQFAVTQSLNGKCSGKNGERR
jgi:hypothetical protein